MERAGDPGEILYHEYTHFLLRNQNRLEYPPWFREGFAELLSTVDVHRGQVRVGMVPARQRSTRVIEVTPADVIRARSIEGWTDARISQFYAQASLVVHYLSYGRPQEEGLFGPRMMRYLDEDFLSALLWAERLHPGVFRGLTFDGRFIAVHWLGGLANDPLATLQASATLWKPFVPRLPSAAPQLMH